jgi:hypothetical protein
VKGQTQVTVGSDAVPLSLASFPISTALCVCVCVCVCV